MNANTSPLRPRLAIAGPAMAGIAIAAIAGAGGYGVARWHDQTAASPSAVQDPTSDRKPLYWYDPMKPGQHFDKPGKSPFMDMQLVPKYAGDGAGDTPGVRSDPAVSQRLGVRTVAVRRGEFATNLSATGTIDFNQRDIAIVQTRAAGFVQRVYGRAPGDVIAAGAPLADLLVPEWGGAQAEFLAVRRTGNLPLTEAARQRLALLGMPSSTIALVERSGRPHNTSTISAPAGGVIKTLNVRTGMTMAAGQTLAEINGFGTVWLNAAVPEAIAAPLRPGQAVHATLPAFPGETLSGRISAILPEAQADSRTLTLRIELPNRAGRLRPGMFAAVSLQGSSQPALLVPSEALIRTGKRTLVMLALDRGRYRPAEVKAGREAANETQILAGLSEGEKIVASGQFLLDSEASLSGVEARAIGAAAPAVTARPVTPPALYETTGRIEQITPTSVTLSHQPVAGLGWPAMTMTMTFRLGDPMLARGFRVGEHVRFGFDQPPTGPTLRRMVRVVGQ